MKRETRIEDYNIYKLVTDPTLTFQSKLYYNGFIDLYVNFGDPTLDLKEVFSVDKIDDLIAHLVKLRKIYNESN